MSSRRSFAWIPLLIALSGAAVGCGNNDETLPQEEEPGNTPSGAPATWTQLNLTVSSEVSVPEECAYPHRITFGVGGNIAAGPCVQGGDRVQGAMTAAEQAHLNMLASEVVQGDPGRTGVCEDVNASAETQLDLTLPDGTSFPIAQVDPDDDEACYRGGVGAAKRLDTYVKTLKRKYYPKRVPTPSPSPSPTPSPTGSPSPGPSPSLSPSPSPSPSPTITASPSPSPSPTSTTTR